MFTGNSVTITVLILLTIFTANYRSSYYGKECVLIRCRNDTRHVLCVFSSDSTDEVGLGIHLLRQRGRRSLVLHVRAHVRQAARATSWLRTSVAAVDAGLVRTVDRGLRELEQRSLLASRHVAWLYLLQVLQVNVIQEIVVVFGVIEGRKIDITCTT